MRRLAVRFERERRKGVQKKRPEENEDEIRTMVQRTG